MVTQELVMQLVNWRIKKILDVAALSLPEDKFQIFRKITLDEFGKRGLVKELEKVLRCQER